MKKLFSFALAGTMLAAFAGCGAESAGRSALLMKAAAAESLSYEVSSSEDYQNYLSTVERFAEKLAPKLVKGTKNSENAAVSPISVYMALSLAAECAAGDTREEIVHALGTTYETLSSQTANLYEGLNAERKDERGKLISKLALGNSVWLQDGAEFKETCLESLSEKYFCHSYSADFANNNDEANKAIRKFVKEQTNGLIDQDFKLPDKTLFTLINTLYLKDAWNTFGEDLDFTEKAYDFRNADGKTTSQNLLQGNYESGRVFEDETFSHFYTRTYRGYTLKFLVPKDGHTAEEIFTEENLQKVAEADYRKTDEEKNIKYYTRCLFPEFEAKFDKKIEDTLSELGIKKLFSNECDLSSFSGEPLRCSEVEHVTKLKVDRTGVEGAAVTIIAGEAGDAPPIWEKVYEEFVVDRAFGFVLTDPNGTTLFSGIVNHI